MPEGPEVRRHAVALDKALAGRKITEIAARTRAAKAWLQENPDTLVGRRILRVQSHGKNLFGLIEGSYFFYSHLMMWGRWQILPAAELQAPDRRERARIVNETSAAILFSAPVFEIGSGDPYAANDYLSALGPDTLPYEGSFDTIEFLRRLLLPENIERDIGVALLDQRIAAGIGNYLRAEILFHCRLDPFRKVGTLTAAELDCLAQSTAWIARQAFEQNGVTISDEWRARMQNDDSLVYPGKQRRETAARHAVFRRTNLPCLVCGGPIRQLRQVTYVAGDDEDGSLTSAIEKSRIIYFCPRCQNTKVELKKPRPTKKAVPV
jgi:formamidopyrimidine-DNA glycosylase